MEPKQTLNFPTNFDKEDKDGSILSDYYAVFTYVTL